MSRIGLLQLNLNHYARAQNLFLHALVECKCGVGIAAEPYKVQADDRGSVAITWKIERRLSKPIVVAGDFNAWNRAWGSRRDNRKGRVLEDWAAVLGLVLLNQDESRHHPPWDAKPSARRGSSPRKRWALKKLNQDRLMASVLSETWPGTDVPQEIEGQVSWLGGLMARACDVAIPRVRLRPRRVAYWWTEEIAELRRTSVQARYRFIRARRRDLSEATEEALGAYREARNALNAAIRKAKAKA
ncbi:uncharacterized protein [Anoplolepis gracilipes]|uniref:uncharacterized protein n=1 Tax=Anoplolepis gracilipes TaxID=354296 RepID=UPI003BA04CC8